MAAFTIIVFGSRVLQSVLDGDERVRKSLMAVAGGLTLITVVMTVATTAANGWALTAARSLILLLLFAVVRRIPLRLTLAVLVAFVIIDLAPIAQRLSPTLPASFYTEAPKVVRDFQQTVRTSESFTSRRGTRGIPTLSATWNRPWEGTGPFATRSRRSRPRRMGCDWC